MRKKTLVYIGISLFFLSSFATANELYPQDWNFPTPERMQVSQNRILLYCDANPSRCPAALKQSRRRANNSSGESLVEPNTNSTANNISVVVTGNDSNVECLHKNGGF